VLPDHLAAEIDLGSLALPPVFAWLKREANLDDAEMLRTFNCGVGMIVVAGARDAKRLLASLGPEAQQIGTIVARDAGAAIRFEGSLEPAGRN
jgi:phosphoribosylformylglycinamidine cyclo-ligase